MTRQKDFVGGTCSFHNMLLIEYHIVGARIMIDEINHFILAYNCRFTIQREYSMQTSKSVLRIHQHETAKVKENIVSASMSLTTFQIVALGSLHVRYRRAQSMRRCIIIFTFCRNKHILPPSQCQRLFTHTESFLSFFHSC